jgi:hypothetical protein
MSVAAIICVDVVLTTKYVSQEVGWEFESSTARFRPRPPPKGVRCKLWLSINLA